MIKLFFPTGKNKFWTRAKALHRSYQKAYAAGCTLQDCHKNCLCTYNRDGKYPKNSFGRLVGRLVEPLFVVHLVVQLVGYYNLKFRQFLIDQLSQNIGRIFGLMLEFWINFGPFWTLLGNFGRVKLILGQFQVDYRAILGQYQGD